MTFTRTHLIDALVVPIALTIGILTRGSVTPVGLAVAMTAAGTTVLPVGLWLRNRRPRRKFEDWRGDPRPSLPAAAVDHVTAVLADRFPKRAVRWRYLPCNNKDTEEGCTACTNTGVVFFPEASYVLIGHNATDSAEAAMFVLGHEAGHFAPLPRVLYQAVKLRAVVFFLAGFFFSTAWMVVVACGLYVLMVAAMWAMEILCDREGATLSGREAGAAYFGEMPMVRVDVASDDDGPVMRWLWRAFAWVVVPLVVTVFVVPVLLYPSHPPSWLRAALIRRTGKPMTVPVL